MTKPVRAGNAASKTAAELQLEIFKAQMRKWGFKKVKTTKKIVDIFRKKRKAPKRVTEDNILQLTYVCKLANGYDVYILVGILDGRLTISGYPWVHIRNSKEERMVTWKFFKNNITDLLQRLAAYAHYAKSIAEARPEGCKLVQTSYLNFAWQDHDGVIVSEVDPIIPLGKLSKDHGKIVKTGERSRKYYWEKSKDTVKNRQKETYTQWETQTQK